MDNDVAPVHSRLLKSRVASSFGAQVVEVELGVQTPSLSCVTCWALFRQFAWALFRRFQAILGIFRKTRKGCGCPKFLAGKVFGQILTLLENFSPIFRQHECYPCQGWALSGKENSCWKIGRTFGNAAGFSPPRPPQLLEFF